MRKLIVGSSILTHSGQLFDYANPDPATITIEDVAHGLSNFCRYVGQCDPFYSVAEHSVHVSRILQPQYAMWGLLHDASEAYIGDVAKPLKNMLPDYMVIEQRVEHCINTALGLKGPMPPIVKMADIHMLNCEQMQIMPPCDDVWMTPELRTELDRLFPKIIVRCWPPAVAKKMFLERYEELRRTHVAHSNASREYS